MNSNRPSFADARRLPKLARNRVALLAAAAIAIALAPLAQAYDACAWEKQIVAACLVLEASDQGERGMRAVASVIANRAGGDPSRILRTVKRPYAFSALNAATTGRTGSAGYAGHVRRASRDANWSLARAIVDELYANQLADVTHGADHYVRRDHSPSWARTMVATIAIGDHLFFRSM